MPESIPARPLSSIPAWAVLQRRLFDEIEDAWRLFSESFTRPDGGLRFDAVFEDRDGVDDLYEPFFNWPAFYLLGGSDDVLAAAKHHWAGVTAQLAEAGMVTGEYENGYDWFHQGESLIFFYALCAADPADPVVAERARRFAELYTDDAHGNYDSIRNIITAPHNGALGPRPGLSDQPEPYSSERREMRPYGLPLQFVRDVDEWDDLADPALAAAMGEAMHRAAAGDVAVNLAATSLVANRWLYDGDEASAAWLRRYVDGWRARAAANGGLLPDNVAPDGTVGGLHDGRWFGGHYGWTWPHGLPSIGMAAVIAGINESFLTGDDEALDPARALLDTVLDNAIVAPIAETPFSLRGGWLGRWGADAATPALLVPHRFGRHGWFDYGPMPLELPLWVWWWSRRADDLARVRRAVAGLPAMAEPVKPFRDKAEAGHEAPWLAFLDGDLPDYPARALEMALGQVARRVALMQGAATDPDAAHLHFWQRVNPVVTEVLSQLVSGTPQVLYNGGLPFAAVVYEDPDAGRPGLPPDVAALVSRLDGDDIDVALVNTSTTRARRVAVRASRFGERRIGSVTVQTETGGAYPGRSTAYASSPGAPATVTRRPATDDDVVLIVLPPAHRADLILHTVHSGVAPRHRRAASTLPLSVPAEGVPHV